jgi:hypothetical protein
MLLVMNSSPPQRILRFNFRQFMIALAHRSVTTSDWRILRRGIAVPGYFAGAAGASPASSRQKWKLSTSADPIFSRPSCPRHQRLRPADG